MERSDTLVIVPALNEEHTIAAVVREAKSMLSCDVLVINDGSNDGTVEQATGAGAMVLSHPFNLGVGSAIRTGLRFALAEGYENAVQIDADGQHPPAQAKLLLARLLDGHDLVVGSRFPGGYEVSTPRRLAMRGLASVASRSVGAPITDATSGFRAFGPRVLEEFARHYPSAYLSDTVEALLLAGRAGLKVVEEPVEMLDRQGGQPSAGFIKSAGYLMRLYLVILMHPLPRPHPAG